MGEKDLLLETCVLAGKIMVENGAEMYRVEDTMNRIANNYHQEEGISFVTQTIVLMGLESTKNVQMKRISQRSTNLEKVSKVNDFSWQFSKHQIDLEELYQALQKLLQETPPKETWLKIGSAAILSGSLMILLGGQWPDFFATVIVGAGGYSVYMLSSTYLKLQYVDEFLASFAIGVLAFFMTSIGIGSSIDNMIIGSIMPLVPGVAITNTVRDLQEGHMLSGISRGVEALIIAMMIGAGIAVAFNVMN